MPLSQKTQVHNIYSRLGRHATLKGRYINNYDEKMNEIMHELMNELISIM